MEIPFFEGWGDKPTKHGLCRGHVKLACGCRICARPGLNSDSKGNIPEAHVAQLEKFHAKMHRVEALRQKVEHRRPKGDGLIEFAGRRIRPSRLAWAKYEVALAEYKAKLKAREQAQALRSWVRVNAPNPRAFEHDNHYLRRVAGEWVNSTWPYALNKCALCSALIAKVAKFEAALAKRRGDIRVSGDTDFAVDVPEAPRAPIKPERQKVEPPLIKRSKFHRHTKACREPIPTADKFERRLGSIAYNDTRGLTIGYVIDGQTVEVPPHQVLNISAASDSRKGHYGWFYFPPAPLMVAFERCKLNGAPIPAKRVPTAISRTYKRWIGQKAKERKAEAERRAAA
jgi:hypothetical protein